MFHERRIWSITLVAERRELVLVVQTHGALGELVLGDDVTLLDAAVLGVTWEEEEEAFVTRMPFEKVLRKPILRFTTN